MSLSPKQEQTWARKVLAAYSSRIAAYRRLWSGIPPDRTAHLNAWAAARKEFPREQERG